MVLCLGSFLLIPILILCILPMFPLHGIKEHIDVIGLLIFGLLFYFGIGLKLIIKHSDKYYYKLLFNEDLSIIPPTKIETKWKKSRNKTYQKYGYSTYIDVKTNNVYISKTKMNNEKSYHVLPLEEKDTSGRNLFLVQETLTEIKPVHHENSVFHKTKSRQEKNRTIINNEIT